MDFIKEAIEVAEYIITQEDFNLKVQECNGELYFQLEDMQGANLADIESEIFTTLAQVIDRLDNYHNDYFYEPYENRVKKEEILVGDYDKKVIMFLESDFCARLLEKATPSDYLWYTTKPEWFNGSSVEEALGKLLDCEIANKIINSQSGYVMVMFDKVFLSPCGSPDIFDNIREALNSLTDNEDTMNFDSFADIIDNQCSQVIEDLRDLGLQDIYLNENELTYMGINQKYIEAAR